MPQRFLRPGITTSDNWNSVSWECQSFYIRLLTLVDDYGRFDGRASVIWGQSFTVWNDQNPSNPVGLQQVAQMLQQLAASRLIEFFVHEGKPVLQITRWQERIRAGVKERWPISGTSMTYEQVLQQVAAIRSNLLPSSPSSSSPPTPPPSLSQGVESDPNLWPLKTPPAEPIQAGRERSEPIHQWFCKETGTEIRLDMPLERKWFDFFRAGFNEDQFKQVVAYLRKKVRTKERNEGALKLSNILDPERFNEDLALAQIAKPVAKPKQPAPTPLPPAPAKTAEEWEKGAQMARELREKLEKGELV